ncbi:MAG: AtpZ/AtpI family protein [Hyphomicrobiaceae bacterium]
MAIDLVAGVTIGFGIGWALDRAFNSRPAFMIVFIILGFAAGMLNLIRTARRMQAEAEPMQRAAPSVRDEDDEADRR